MTAGHRRFAPLFRVAVPGADQKLVAALWTPLGDWRYAKLPAVASAVPVIEREADALADVSRRERLRSFLPEFHRGRTIRGDAMLVLDGGPARRGPRQFGRLHTEFLDSLVDATGSVLPFEDTGLVERWTAVIDDLADPPGSRGTVPFRKAVERVRSELAGRRVRIVLAHGDFTRWNTRRGKAGLFVFDWEAARPGLLGLDALHFDALPRMLTGGTPRRHAVAMNWIRRHTVAGEGEVADTIWWLAFLIEIGLHYAHARVREPERGSDAVPTAVRTAIDAALEDAA